MTSWLYAHIVDTNSSVLTVRFGNLVQIRSYKITKVDSKPSVQKFSWRQFKYVPATTSEANQIEDILVDFYFRRVKKSGIKDLAELNTKKLLQSNNPYYEIIVRQLKQSDILPCSTDEEYETYNPMAEDFVRALKMVEYFERTSEEVLKEQLYNTYKEQLGVDGKGQRQFVKEWLAENPHYEKYQQYQKIKSGDFGTTPVEFAVKLLYSGIEH